MQNDELATELLNEIFQTSPISNSDEIRQNKLSTIDEEDEDEEEDDAEDDEEEEEEEEEEREIEDEDEEGIGAAAAPGLRG